MIRFVEELIIIEVCVFTIVNFIFSLCIFARVATFLIGTQKLFSNLDT